MRTICLFFVCFAQSVHAAMFTTVEGGAKCSLGYESITSTWQNCKQAATWYGVNKDNIVFVDNKSSEPSAYPPGCYWELDTIKGYREFCHLAKGGIPRERHTTLFFLTLLANHIKLFCNRWICCLLLTYILQSTLVAPRK